jgi:hypothetical protein
MKSFKGFALGLVLGLGLAVSGIAFAQNTTQGTQKKEGESCCGMTSCCCKGDSCSTKENKNQASQPGDCCCCGGDSCDMRMHDTREKPKS